MREAQCGGRSFRGKRQGVSAFMLTPIHSANVSATSACFWTRVLFPTSSPCPPPEPGAQAPNHVYASSHRHEQHKLSILSSTVQASRRQRACMHSY